VWITYRRQYWTCVGFIVTGEGCGLLAAYWISLLINFILDEEMDIKWGILHMFIFVFLNFMSLLCRNYYIQYGMITCINIRRTLVAALFKKVESLSMKSLSETSSGKLVSLISADMF
jgi:hypothetical protein